MKTLYIESRPTLTHRIGLGIVLIVSLLYSFYANEFIWTAELGIIIAACFFAFSFVFFSKIKGSFEPNAITLKFWFIKKKIPISEVQYITIDQISIFSKFWGYGYRLNFNNEVGFVFESPYVIKIILRNKKTYYISFDEEHSNDVFRFFEK